MVRLKQPSFVSFRAIIIALLVLSLVTMALAAGCSRRPVAVAPPPGGDGSGAGGGNGSGGNGNGSDGSGSGTGAPDLAAIQAKYKPNELGRVMILEYHVIGDKDGRWERSAASFRHDLEELYADGYRLVSLKDYVAGKINLPAGLSPVILTFDDGTAGQFRYIEQDGQQVIDPNSAVGVIMDFAKEHPDMGTAATFYVLFPPFGQPALWPQKVKFMIDHGMDIGNHSMTHPISMRKLTDEQVQKELAYAAKMMAAVVPGYQVRSLALPNGIETANRELETTGTYDGVTYRNDAVLLVGAEPAPSPFAKNFNPYRLPRVQVFDQELDKWLTFFKNNPSQRYISDGDSQVISVPKLVQDRLRPDLVGSVKVSVYEPAPH